MRTYTATYETFSGVIATTNINANTHAEALRKAEYYRQANAEIAIHGLNVRTNIKAHAEQMEEAADSVSV
jgi:hypothetical protein